jgi:hypothetical protein
MPLDIRQRRVLLSTLPLFLVKQPIHATPPMKPGGITLDAGTSVASAGVRDPRPCPAQGGKRISRAYLQDISEAECIGASGEYMYICMLEMS